MRKFIVESENDELTVNHIIDTLENEFDIVATVKEVKPIDEEKLDELANDNCSWCDITNTEGISGMDLRESFKAGYIKAMEE